MGSHSKPYRALAHPRDTAKLVLALAAIAIPGFFVTVAVNALVARAGMNPHVETALAQVFPLAWILGSLYLIKIVLGRREAGRKSAHESADGTP